MIISPDIAMQLLLLLLPLCYALFCRLTHRFKKPPIFREEKLK